MRGYRPDPGPVLAPLPVRAAAMADLDAALTLVGAAPVGERAAAAVALDLRAVLAAAGPALAFPPCAVSVRVRLRDLGIGDLVTS